ncbi:MAG: MTH1187 family thiamine-binding protein [Dissulfurimicrobium sp.]|uniref:MTH1187 family thiamine-binding protein n=1 Tax=Dissulfurimicrobium TaxID=1769732 RepID=UPI001EDC7466|nr:MTH1187 family thiamine-binding protein [Dissulfurimicrobium hydrothermale]UKL13190.1 MTH1187 family thiamine-binding protein [Dissulfurimicrobium hydrothermale]
MAIMEISVVPLGTGSTSFHRFVVKMQEVLAGLGLPYKLTDMGTLVEGDIDTLMSTAKILHNVPFSMGEKRVYTAIKIDDRRDKEVHLGQKTSTVRQYLAEEDKGGLKYDI